MAKERLHVGVAGPASPRLFAADLGLPASVLPEGLGGTPVNHLIRAWLEAGHRVSLATLDRSHTAAEPAIFRGERLTIAVGPYRASRRARDAFRVERDSIAMSLRDARPQAISAHWSYEFALGAIESGVPTMVTVRDVPQEIFRLQPTPYRLVRWQLHRRAMERAARVVFNSPYTKARLRHRRSEGATVLPNAIPDDQWKLPDRALPVRGAPYFISVNNGFGVRKNVRRLLEAFGLVLRAVPMARLRLVGQGFGPGEAAEQWARSHALADGVELLGERTNDETVDLIRQADVLVHPSLEESFGYTLIEAASVGTPVIGGRESGAVPWVLEGGNCGVLVDVTKAEDIAVAMGRLIDEPDRWQGLREHAFSSGRARFSASKVAAAYVQELKAIVR